jgi:hypothetical protein
MNFAVLDRRESFDLDSRAKAPSFWTAPDAASSWVRRPPAQRLIRAEGLNMTGTPAYAGSLLESLCF